MEPPPSAGLASPTRLPPMPDQGDEEPSPGAAPAPAGRELMDLDLDLDAASWPFDPTAAFVSSPLTPFLLSSSPPQSLLHLSFPPPPSPLWIFDDRAAELSGSLADCPRLVPGNSDATNVAIKRDGGVTRLLELPAADENFHSSCVIKERMSQALRYFKESTDQLVLVQVWAPMRNGDRYILTTSGQPFVLDPQSTRLLQYRTLSSSYVFSLDDDSDDGDLGLPGRVFKQKRPEWTPNVQYYSSKEYPRLDHALRYDVQGTLALPVFEPSGQSCVGVVELIMTSPKIHYAPEVDKVCKALEAVNLKSSEILDHPNVQICNEGRRAALSEILEILTVVCEAHKLPLAQTWVPCRHRSVLAHGGGLKKSCSSFDGGCMGQVCMSTTDVAFYVIDPHMWGFRDACVEHHLQKGQGVAGRAFGSHRACFCGDVTRFCKTEYPLVHYARMFELAGCLAICLQSTQSGNDDYILEFFLPPKCKDTSQQQVLLDSISSVMKQCFRSLKVINGLNSQEGLSLEIIDMLANKNHEPICSQSCETHGHTSPEINNPEGLDDSQNEGNAIPDSREQHVVSDVNAENNGSGTCGPVLGDKNNVILQRRRGKAEKSISLEVLQQYFSGSLKDAAKSLGVCPTTMKRICRQHGISRWPSRKINKVNRSLSKLKRVMESVQGAEGAFNLTSLACPLPVAAGSISWPANSVGPTQSKGGVRDKDSSPSTTPESDDGHIKLVVQKEPAHYQTGSQLEPSKESDCSKTRSSSEGSMDTPSQGSCQGSPAQEIHPGSPFSSPKLKKQEKDICGPLGLTSQLVGDSNMPPVFSMPEANTAEPGQLLSGMLIEDSGSSKDLRNLCNSAGEGRQDDCAMAPTQNPPPATATQEPRTVTIKACYKEDIIRFRLPCTDGVVALNDEVAKRLKLEVGTFDIKYLDDDHEWVGLACDADLEECIEISRLSGAHVIRLVVHDIVATLGSSCESSGE